MSAITRPKNMISQVLTRLLHPTAKPTAVLIKPSIPLAPLFPTTQIKRKNGSEFKIIAAVLCVHLDHPCPYMSASRIAILFPTKRAVSYESASEIIRATWGSVKEYSAEIWNDNSLPTYKTGVKELSKGTKTQPPEQPNSLIF